MIIYFRHNLIKYQELSAIIFSNLDGQSLIKFIFKTTAAIAYNCSESEYLKFTTAFKTALINDYETIFHWPLSTENNNDE